MEKKLVYKLIHSSGSWFVTEDIQNIAFEIEGEDKPDEGETIKWTIEVFWMTQDELDAMPDFDGF